MPFIPQPECDTRMRALSGGAGVPVTALCAGLAPNNADSCQGDSGGPITLKRPGAADTLLGIVSFGPSAACGAPGRTLGAYTDLRHPGVRAWVRAVAGV